MSKGDMRTKGCRTGAVLGMLAASLALASVASAATVYTNQPGSVCKNYIPSEAGTMDYFSNGLKSTKVGTTTIVCPLTRPSAFNNQGADVYVDVNHSGIQTTSCTLYSSKAGGVLLGSKSASFTGSGYGYVYLSLRGSNLSNYTSDYSVICTIAGSGKTLVSGVHSNEF